MLKRTPVKKRRMAAIFIPCRQSFADAAELIEAFGENAKAEAAVRANRSRDDGNVLRFCHWRQIERVVVALGSAEILGSIH